MSGRSAVVRRLAGQPRVLDAIRAADAWRLARRLDVLHYVQRSEPVIVFQMGKVGSSSVAASFPTDHHRVVIHTHHLSALRVDEAVSYARATGLPVRRHFFHARVAAHNVVESGRPFKVISLVREPVGRSVSKFFHDFERFVGCPAEHSDHSMDEIIEIFLANEAHIDDEAHWFEHQFEPALGVDVYAEAFDPAVGSAQFTAGAGTVLLMRLELDDADKERVIADFLGEPGFTLDSANVGEARGDGDGYRQFKAEAKLPADYLERKLTSRFATHFYSADERAAIADRWS